jgi:hypothetical protein
VDRLRIFHLGRELKTAGRSLETLGVGREGFTVLHVHTTPVSGSSAGATTATGAAASAAPVAPTMQQSGRVDHLVREPRSVAAVAEPEVEVVAVQRSKRRSAAADAVVDLADDSENDDDDDECVVIDHAEATTASRSSKRSRRAGNLTT